jgi:chemotaxis protein MotB
MADKSLAPIIIKKKKIVVGGGHHGGAWKVAYADFVTAMMAFFLLMWLLNATTEKQRKGLADYFSPVIPINRVSGGGDGAFWGDSVFAEDTLAQNGVGAESLQPTEQLQSRGEVGETGSKSDEGLKAAEDLLSELTERGGESLSALRDMPHVVTRLSDVGLVIDIYELPDARLFDPVTGKTTRLMNQTLAVVVEAMRMVTNQISVAGHVSARPVVLAANPVWDDSTNRAQAVRGVLERAGFPSERVLRVTGYADRQLADPDPMSLRNSRVEITILRDDV